ncbi:MAG: HEPN domain-containing protein [Armatimonadia bacterium]|nr:HEPN domain-containing protein [Armatimonadia bacterium]
MSETDEARVWLAYAQEDLDAAGHLIEASAAPRIACFLCQQAAEKSIKALLMASGIGFPRTHDLLALALLAPGPAGLARHRDALALLTQWAVLARYPTGEPDASPLNAAEAHHAAALIVEACEPFADRCD